MDDGNRRGRLGCDKEPIFDRGFLSKPEFRHTASTERDGCAVWWIDGWMDGGWGGADRRESYGTRRNLSFGVIS